MDKSAQIKIIKAKIALLDTEKEQLIEKLCNIEKEAVPLADFPPVILENPSNQFNWIYLRRYSNCLL
jgi:hypothetical protein